MDRVDKLYKSAVASLRVLLIVRSEQLRISWC